MHRAFVTDHGKLARSEYTLTIHHSPESGQVVVQRHAGVGVGSRGTDVVKKI
jgi:hypothetical protein